MDDFAGLVASESRGLVAAVTAIVGDRHRAEEVVQEAFERCYRRWGRVSRLDKPGAWVRRVAINQAISVQRRASTEIRVVQRVGALGPSAGGVGEDPLAALDDEGLWTAVRALPRDQAVAIALRYGADLGVDAIADTLDTTVPGVKSLLHRGRAALRSSPEVQAYAARGADPS